MADPADVLASYTIGEIREVHVAGGTAGKCWRVAAASGDYFLRCRGTRTGSPEAIRFDHALRSHLLAGGVPTAEPLLTASGETWVVADGRAFELYPLVAGRPFRLTQTELLDTARALARFHLVAARFPGRGTYNPIPTQFANAVPGLRGSDRMDDPVTMLAACEQLAREEPALAGVVERARRLAQTYDDGVYRALPRWLIHGDYHPGNLLYTDEGVVAGIFDFDWACEHTRSRDLADGVYYFAARRPARFDDASIWSMTEAVDPDLETAAWFISGYREVAPIEPEELRAIPLAWRARFLAERLEGSAKVPAEQKAHFITRDFEEPLQWLDHHGEELVRCLL